MLPQQQTITFSNYSELYDLVISRSLNTKNLA